MGPSAFTEKQFKDNMLEIEVPRDESPVMTDLSRGDKFALVQLYREAVRQLFPSTTPSHHADTHPVKRHTRLVHRCRDTWLPRPAQRAESEHLHRSG